MSMIQGNSADDAASNGHPGTRYEVVNQRTGERYGNHTYWEAVSRARIMQRNWQGREKFTVRPRENN